MSAKAKDLLRQQYLVSRKSARKLREMSHREGVSAGELVRRAIEAYISGKYRTEPEQAVARKVLRDIHVEVRATLARIDVNLAEIHAREQALADGTFHAKVVAETQAWLESRPHEALQIAELFAPLATV